MVKFPEMHRAWRSQPGHCSNMMTQKSDTEKVRNDPLKGDLMTHDTMTCKVSTGDNVGSLEI